VLHPGFYIPGLPSRVFHPEPHKRNNLMMLVNPPHALTSPDIKLMSRKLLLKNTPIKKIDNLFTLTNLKLLKTIERYYQVN
ncbi:MAG: hypothetical protein WBA74_10875, partial [Cyclobacteriaceae bacterium]